MLALRELLHNLKDRDWDVNPVYKMDENEARRIIEGIEEIDKKIADYTYTIGLLQDRLEAVNKWIPLTKRPMTEEETEHYFEYTDMMFDNTYTILDCPLPEDGQEVLVSCGGYVCVDTFCNDDGCYFEGVDIDDVQAWMPLPEPYKAESEG